MPVERQTAADIKRGTNFTRFIAFQTTISQGEVANTCLSSAMRGVVF